MTAPAPRKPVCQEISRALLDELFEKLRQGEHLALVAPRQAGKAQTIYELRRRAETLEARQPRLVILRRTDFNGATEADWLAALESKLIPTIDQTTDELGTVADDVAPMTVEQAAESRHASLEAKIQKVLVAAIGHDSSPLWLVIQSIPELPGPLVRGLLTACQYFSQDPHFHSRFSVLVTGSHNMVSLTYGENSPYRQAEKFFVVGFDRELTRRVFFARVQGVSLERGLEDPRCDGPMEEDALAALHEWTGGNAGLIEELVLTMRRAGVSDQEEPSYSICWTRDRIDQLARRFIEQHMVFHRYSALNLEEIEADRGDWDLLQTLLPTGDAEALLFPRGPSPCRLLTSGIVRDDGPDGRWRISCGIWREFLRVNMGPTRRADVFALQGRWKQAWQLYSTIPSSVADRPLDGEPRYYWKKVLHLWEETLSDDEQFDLDTPIAPPGSETSLSYRLWQFFTQGMQALYGIQAGRLQDPRCQAVHYTFPQPSIDFEPLFRSGDLWTDSSLRFIDGRSRILSSPEPNAHWTSIQRQPRLALALPQGHQFDPRVVADLRRSLRRFWSALENVQRREIDRELDALRQRHLQVIQKINQVAMAETRHPDRLLQSACRALVNLGDYFRILISLVSPDGARITGIASACAQPGLDFTDPTHYPLTPLSEGNIPDIQQWVVLTRQSATIQDARRNVDGKQLFRGNTDQAQALHIRGLAVIPLLLVHNDDTAATEILGTLHVERSDGQPPSANEIASLEVVAAQLAMAFDQSRRRWMLERALEEIPSEFRLIARDGRVIYRNRAAALTDGDKSSRWLAPLAVPPGLLVPLPASSTEAVQLALGQAPDKTLETISLFREDQADGSRGSRRWDETVAPLQDFRNRLPHPFEADGWVGVVQQSTDVTDFVDLSQLVRNTLVVTDLEETCQRVLNFFQQRGHRWARLYLCHESNDKTETLQSKAQFGIPDPEVATRFQQEEYTITQSDQDEAFWFLFKEAELRPVIFEHDETIQAGPVAMEVSPGALKTYRTRDRWRKEFGKTDPRWLEIPLFLGNLKLGLLALELPTRFTAYEQETLCWACNCISLALHAAQQALASSQAAEAQGLLEGAKSAAAMAVHQLANIFGPIESASIFLQEDLQQLPLPKVQTVSMRADVGLIERNTVRARAILGDFSRYFGDRALSDVATAPVKPLIEQLVAELRYRWKDIAFSTHFTGSVGNADEARAVVSWSGLQEVFEILAANADRHGRRTEAPLQIEIEILREHGRLRILFRDNGMGITPAARYRIFQPFFTTSAKGTGLGLAIARNLMRRMQGGLEIVEPQSRGACFQIDLASATEPPPRAPSLGVDDV
jgi:signal transduction histidine kinase